MEEKRFLRVVALHRGRVKPSEFKLRRGEKGLSLFATSDRIKIEEIIEAVREAGKAGDLAAAILSREDFRSLGLILLATPGLTPNAEINSVHREARLPFSRRFLLWLRGIPVYDYFNDHFSVELCTRARIHE